MHNERSFQWDQMYSKQSTDDNLRGRKWPEYTISFCMARKLYDWYLMVTSHNAKFHRIMCDKFLITTTDWIFQLKMNTDLHITNLTTTPLLILWLIRLGKCCLMSVTMHAVGKPQTGWIISYKDHKIVLT